MSIGRTYVLRDEGVVERFKRFLDELPKDRLWEITVAPFKARHTSGQRAKWHAQISEIARETGNDPDDVKEYLKTEFGPKKEVTIAGEQRLVPRSSSSYNAEEYSEMIDRTSAWAAGELSIFV
jgi:predicted transcriptional regulator